MILIRETREGWTYLSIFIIVRITPSTRHRMMSSLSWGSMWMSLAPMSMASTNTELVNRMTGGSSARLTRSWSCVSSTVRGLDDLHDLVQGADVLALEVVDPLFPVVLVKGIGDVALGRDHEMDLHAGDEPQIVHRAVVEGIGDCHHEPMPVFLDGNHGGLFHDIGRNERGDFLGDLDVLETDEPQVQLAGQGLGDFHLVHGAALHQHLTDFLFFLFLNFQGVSQGVLVDQSGVDENLAQPLAPNGGFLFAVLGVLLHFPFHVVVHISTLFLAAGCRSFWFVSIGRLPWLSRLGTACPPRWSASGPGRDAAIRFAVHWYRHNGGSL